MKKLDAIQAELTAATQGPVEWEYDGDMAMSDRGRDILKRGLSPLAATYQEAMRNGDIRCSYRLIAGGRVIARGLTAQDAVLFRNVSAHLEPLLAVANAVRRMPEPSILVKGQMRCALCDAEVVLRGHKGDCPWMAVVDAVRPLLEEVES